MVLSKLKQLRIENGLTQEDMGDMLGISRTAYLSKEIGTRGINLNEAKKISDLFQCSIEDIFFESCGYEK